MFNGLYVLGREPYDLIYGPTEREKIARLVHLTGPPQTAESVRDHLDLLAEVDVMLSGWGAPRLDAELLGVAHRLRLVFYGAGSVRGIVTEESWERGVRITSAYAANAVPVAEYALAAILFSLKHGWQYARLVRERGQFPARTPVPGAYGSVVGLISLGMVGRLVRERLRPFDLRVLAYDPYVQAAEAKRLDVQLADLDTIFRECDVVSLHTPWLKETEGLITGRHFSAMKPGSTFINTARGAVVCEDEMIAVLQQRPDLQAVLDVTYPEPPAARSALYSLPNVVLTPHIAGAMNRECQRMGRVMVEELQRFVAGQPLQWEITREKAARLA